MAQFILFLFDIYVGLIILQGNSAFSHFLERLQGVEEISRMELVLEIPAVRLVLAEVVDDRM